MSTKNQKLVDELNGLLADYQIFYQNLRGLHWNVKGAQFFSLHEKYEELYNETADVVDEIAERILMVEGQPLHTFADYVKVSDLKEAGTVTDGSEGVKIVLDNSQALLKKLYEVLETADGDEGTSALLGDLIGATEKRIWMLKSWLG
ncbi:starvation-inducible DNA-binding protein [Tangfeifania diversioriginum]|uniref:Starvation-inducible DNA-binding protein n=1 Tax=Tangfeifania diversioriginum TaxID=1168035 RepID=A0A1M6DHN3_9BACT|nr:Dps family protein [Tangfeifania diversioriginum]SHI72690.1 starvation-inducible DNA-binding protein [Tangfeifania diversioriginum]